ncbi:MAG: hypothetical protein CL670_11030 [Balneola sp.]|jgi:exodeoxyribonuclease V gamma subunit|nr:hypothetical protein [Balneola sp.]MBE79679.1 hypothetical protein [Balneola sp.]|tara:strand:+ start:25947 stop:29018 length:3072 start_codon:yes stop_codon:yes gene_type:complete
MFNIYQSHSLRLLSNHLSEIFAPDSANPLTQQWVIVQNNEIKEWLSLQLAKDQGIAGNLKFIFPSEFIWLLYRLKHDEVPKVLPSDLQAMQWAIFKQLTTNAALLKQLPSFGNTEGDSKRLFQLSNQLADNFDQYQVYRPDMMENWVHGKLATKHKDEKWQLSIWRSLNQAWNQSEKTRDIPRRSQAYAELLNWLQDPDNEIWDHIPKQLYVFGLSQTSKPFLEVISNLSSQIELQYFTKSVQDVQPHSEIENLVLNWSKPASEQLNLLKSILNNAQLPFSQEELLASERNVLPEIAIHSCHNNRREVEVLKNEILSFLDEHHDAKASDILAMVPDAEEYAGILETVFNEEEPVLPVSQLSGKNYQSAEYTISELLELLSSSFKATAVLQLLNLEPVKSKFKLTDDHLDLLEDWILVNRVHRSLGEEFNEQYSWRKGLNQLISGFMMQSGSLGVYNGLVPFGELSSSDDAELTANFSQFIHALKDAKNRSESSKTPSEWIEFTESLVDTFVGQSDGKEAASASLRKLLDKLRRQMEFTEENPKVNFDLIKDWLTSQLKSHDSSSGRFGQGVTVSSYIPYRSVPFKFIAMLGINEGVFPRKAVRPEFDLIYAQPKPGDRILKEDDSYLFLETLQAAETHLHLSYKGQDQRSDSERLPSILIQQLLDTKGEEGKGIIRHSLHPFNKKYFDGKGLKSYSDSNLNLAQKMQLESQDHPILFTDGAWSSDSHNTTDIVHISDIINYFSHPSKYLLQNELNIKNYNSFNEVIDREQFKLQGLDRYKLDDYLFDALANDHPINQVFNFASAAALIPQKLQGKKSFQVEKENIQELVNSLENLTNEEERKEDIRINFEGAEILGIINGIYDDVLVTYRVGKRREKHEVGHWLKHLLLLSNGTPITKSIFLSKDDDSVDILEIPSENIYKNPLNDYLKWFFSNEPILNKAAFFPASSQSFAKTFSDGSDLEKAKSKAESQWQVTKFNQYGESGDYFNALLWRGYNPIEIEAFQQKGLRFWVPFLEAIGGDGA